jgi:predicted alpha-1,2-mannosidase
VCLLFAGCGAAEDIAAVDAQDVHCDPFAHVTDDGAQPATPTAAPLVQWVDPFIGTGGIAYGTGSAYPGPQVPFGMARPGPDTSSQGSAIEFQHCAGYAHDDDVIEGFGHLHLYGAGIADYGGLSLMPTVGMSAAKAKPRAKGSHFSHADEIATPGYYAVTLKDTAIRVELTASARVAFHRYTFPAGADAYVYVDAGSILADGTSVTNGAVTVDPAAREVRGFSHVMGSYSRGYGGVTVYWTVRFRSAFSSFGAYAAGVPEDGATGKTGTDAGAYLHFSDAVVEAEVAASFVDGAHASANLDAETAPFDAARAAATDAWEQRLSAVQLDARSDRDRRIFYTALYHTALMPALASDADGSYRGIDGQVHHTSSKYFSDYSLWDTYRTLHPFITLVYPDDARALADSLVQMGKDAGYLPRWPLATGESGGMIGDGATVVLADTFVKGVDGWDAEAGWQIARRQAMTNSPTGGRGDMDDLLSLGYVSDAKSGSASKTLEYAIADHALGEWAQVRGDTDDRDTFFARGGAWRKLYDPTTHFLFPLSPSGQLDPQDPLEIGGAYVEGSAWHYDFLVPHDIAGLADVMTKPVLLGRLDQFFARFACNKVSPTIPNPYYWPANEPVLFSGFAFGVLGDHTRLGQWVRWTTVTHFGDGPDGIPGNDDSGTMSAFYLFASMGIYPIAGTPKYVLGTPLFPRVVVKDLLTVEAPAASRRTYVPQSVTLNGIGLSDGTIEHAQLAGATLHFDLK